MEQFGEVIGSHIGKFGFDEPVVRFRTQENAEAALRALKTQQVWLDGSVLNGDWLKDTPAPGPEAAMKTGREPSASPPATPGTTRENAAASSALGGAAASASPPATPGTTREEEAASTVLGGAWAEDDVDYGTASNHGDDDAAASDVDDAGLQRQVASDNLSSVGKEDWLKEGMPDITGFSKDCGQQKLCSWWSVFVSVRPYPAGRPR